MRAAYWIALALALLIAPPQASAQVNRLSIALPMRSNGRIVSLITIADADHQWLGAVARHPLVERLPGLDPPSNAAQCDRHALPLL